MQYILILITSAWDCGPNAETVGGVVLDQGPCGIVNSARGVITGCNKCPPGNNASLVRWVDCITGTEDIADIVELLETGDIFVIGDTSGPTCTLDTDWVWCGTVFNSDVFVFDIGTAGTTNGMCSAVLTGIWKKIGKTEIDASITDYYI